MLKNAIIAHRLRVILYSKIKIIIKNQLTNMQDIKTLLVAYKTNAPEITIDTMAQSMRLVVIMDELHEDPILFSLKRNRSTKMDQKRST